VYFIVNYSFVLTPPRCFALPRSRIPPIASLHCQLVMLFVVALFYLFLPKIGYKSREIFLIMQIYFLWQLKKSFSRHNIISAPKGIAGMLNSIQYRNDVLD
jgi:hypothetical protein